MATIDPGWTQQTKLVMANGSQEQFDAGPGICKTLTFGGNLRLFVDKAMITKMTFERWKPIR